MSRLHQPMRRMLSSLIVAGMVAGGGVALAAPERGQGERAQGEQRVHAGIRAQGDKHARGDYRRGGHEHRAHRGAERLASKLELSDSQREQMRELRQAQREPMRELMRERRQVQRELGEYTRSGTDDPARLQALSERMGELTQRQVQLRAQQHSAFHAVLDESQRETLDGLREQRREQWRERREGGKPHGKQREHRHSRNG